MATGGQDIWWQWISPTQIKGFLNSGMTELAVTLDLSAPPSIAASTSGTVTVTATLSDNLQHVQANGPQVASLGNIKVQAVDTDNDVATGQVNLTVKDDVPTAVNDTAAVLEGQSVNAVFVLDFSGSLNTAELDQMLDAVKAAGASLFSGTSGDVQLQIVAFSSSAISYGPFTTFSAFSDQIDDINPAAGGTRPFSGGTDFTAAIERDDGCMGSGLRLEQPGLLHQRRQSDRADRYRRQFARQRDRHRLEHIRRQQWHRGHDDRCW